jgi:ABC-type transport system involved in multi-copper enzyme maturation permease subunit
MRTIALLSFKEILYKRIFLIALLATVAFLIFYGVANHFAAGKIAEEMANKPQSTMANLQNAFLASTFLNMGLYFSSFITALLAILATVGSISGEIESHQIDTLLARPLRRSEVVIGKFIGLGGLLVCYAAFLFTGILLINQMTGGVIKVDLTLANSVQGGLYFVLQPLVIVAVALWLSSRMTTINGGVILIIMYVTAFVGGFVEQFGVAFQNVALQNIGIVSSLIFPTDTLFRKMTGTLVAADNNPIALATQGPFGNLSEPSGLMIGYAVVYGLVTLMFAMRKFGKRDL